MIATTLQGAEAFFLNHSTGSITCKAGDTGTLAQTCECYPDAEEFYRGVETLKQELYAEKTKLLDKHGVFGGGTAVNLQHDAINRRLEALGVDPNS